jgi:hypothetical protein
LAGGATQAQNAESKTDEETKMTKSDAKRRRYAKLTEQLSRIGPVVQGTVTERHIVRDVPSAPGGTKTYGPYYQWTWKQEGKTVTVNLTQSQAKAWQQAIDNHRKMEHVMGEMRKLSLEILEESTEGVKKRQRQK